MSKIPRRSNLSYYLITRKKISFQAYKRKKQNHFNSLLSLVVCNISSLTSLVLLRWSIFQIQGIKPLQNAFFTLLVVFIMLLQLLLRFWEILLCFRARLLCFWSVLRIQCYASRMLRNPCDAYVIPCYASIHKCYAYGGEENLVFGLRKSSNQLEACHHYLVNPS